MAVTGSAVSRKVLSAFLILGAACILSCGDARGAEAEASSPAAWERGLRSCDRLWRNVGGREPYESMGCRTLFRCALTLCEAGQHLDRLPRLIELATRMQDRDPQSRGYGNLAWYWRDGRRVTDRNAVEFCMQDALLTWLRHKDRLPAAAREQLGELLRYGTEGCRRHRDPTRYTYIAVLNAGNLIVLGELLGRPEVAEEGYRRLGAVSLWTWRFGTHEYCSPTYYGVDLSGLQFIASRAQREQGRRQAAALLELLWTDIALNWMPGAARLAGAQSRSYDYLRGLGHLERHVAAAGWLEDSTPGGDPLLWIQGSWSPPERLRKTSRGQFPRLVRQRWGIGTCQSRTHFLAADVTLSTAGATYGNQDVPLNGYVEKGS